MEEQNQVYGIDLGTTNSCIAQIDEFGRPEVKNNMAGGRTTPSVVYFQEEDEIVVGEAAKNTLPVHPDKTVAFVKRKMRDSNAFTPDGVRQFPYGKNPTIISSYILRKLVEDINQLNGKNIKKVVITVPADFGSLARQRTKDAGTIAGLDVIGIINEPTAAAIAYGFGVKETEPTTVLVYDLGGGTFDASFVRIGQTPEGKSLVKVIASDGDNDLGGVNWDEELAKLMLNRMGINQPFNQVDQSLQYMLLIEAEKVKKDLTAVKEANWNFAYQGNNYQLTVTREEFERLTKHLLDRTIEKIKGVISEANRLTNVGNPQHFILVGGSSRMPQVMQRINEEFGCEAKIKDPDESVAKGAAIYANNINKIDITETIDVLSRTYGTDCNNGMVSNILFKNMNVPVKQEKIFVTALDNQEVVSMKIFESKETPENNPVPEDRCVLVMDEYYYLEKKHLRGTPIKVELSVEKDGIIQCCAEVEGEQPLQFQFNAIGMSSQEIEAESRRTVKIL